MLTRVYVDPATLQRAREVGLSPAALVRRCVSTALRRAASSFWRGALTPPADISARSATECRAGCLASSAPPSSFLQGALTPSR